MRKSPLILAAFFVFVTLSRVSHFSASMGDKLLSFAFALGLGAVIFAASYWTQYRGNTAPSAQESAALQRARRFAWIVLSIATLIDGSFNLADVLSANEPEIFPLIYGITPTLLSLLLGILQARIDELPELRRGSGYTLARSTRSAIKRALDRFQPEPLPEEQPSNATQPEPLPEEQQSTATQPEPLPDPLPEGFPAEGSSREKIEAFLKVDPELSGATLAHWLKITPSRARALKREIIGSNGHGKNELEK